MNGVYGEYTGIPCILAGQIKKQKKTHKNKLINWIYKITCGYKYESTMPEGMDVVFMDGKLVFRDQTTLDKFAGQINTISMEATNDQIK